MDQPSSGKAVKQTTSLLDLPAEIWSKIGKLVVDESTTITKEYFRQRRRSRTYHQPPITRTCRILRQELLSYFYRTKINVWPQTCYNLGPWVRALDRELRSSIDGLMIQCDASKKDRERVLITEGWEVDVLLKEVKILHWGPTLYAVKFV